MPKVEWRKSGFCRIPLATLQKRLYRRQLDHCIQLLRLQLRITYSKSSLVTNSLQVHLGGSVDRSTSVCKQFDTLNDLKPSILIKTPSGSSAPIPIYTWSMASQLKPFPFQLLHFFSRIFYNCILRSHQLQPLIENSVCGINLVGVVMILMILLFFALLLRHKVSKSFEILVLVSS